MGWGGRDAWCAAFVSWCGNECGYIESGIMPKSGWCNDFRDYFKNKNEWKDAPAHGGHYIPQAGDFILFDWAGSTTSDLDHIGIVEKYENGIVYTVEGNSSDAVRCRTYAENDSHIIGYCTPAYPSSGNGNIGELVGATKAEKVYRAFVSAGYSKEAAAAVVGNLAGEGGTDANDDIVINSTEGGSGEGVGICQWSFGRKNSFLAFAQSKGEPWPNTSLKLQIEYMMQELETDQWLWSSIGAEYGSQYNISFSDFKQSKDVEYATTAFCAKFERCHAVNSHIDVRIEYAKRVLNSFG